MIRQSPLIPLLLLLMALPAPPDVSGQARHGLADTAGAAADSAAVRRDARRAQARFERVRRSHLPWTWAGGGGECDERIGRYCLSHTDGAPDWEPPAEEPEVREAREALLRSLDDAARALPGDAWVAGQRVRYLIEAERPDEASAAAAQCRAERWWCEALAGYAAHHAGRDADALDRFQHALRRMPEEQRRAWVELSVLLEGEPARRYHRLDAAGREAFALQYWHTARPLYLLPGNALLAEHLSRHVMARLQQEAASPDKAAWGKDLHEILLRFGWPIGWERIRPRRGQMGDAGLISHHRDAVLLPPPGALGDPDDGALRTLQPWVQPRRARADHALPGLRLFGGLTSQVAIFHRGDSARIVAAYQLPEDSLPADTRLQAALAVLAADAAEPWITRSEPARPRGAMALQVPAGPATLSLEVYAPEEQRGTRARHRLDVQPLPRGLLAASDLLLLEAPEPLPDSLADAVRAARSDARVRPGERIGVYWELYGLGLAPEQLQLTLRLVDHDRGWLRRLGERVGVVDRMPPVRLRWNERAQRPVLPRAVAIEIPDVRPGEYALELSIQAAGRQELTVSRVLQVVETP